MRVNISDVRDEHSLSLPGPGPGRPLQPRRADEPPRLDAEPLHRPRDQLPQPALDPRGLPAPQPGDQGRLRRARARSTGGREYLPVDEKHPLAPGRRQRHQQDGGRVVPPALRRASTASRSSVLRLTNTYGPRMRVKDARQTFLGFWFRLVLDGRGDRTSSATARSGATSTTSTTPSGRSSWRLPGRGRRRGLQPRRRRGRDAAGARGARSSTSNGAARYRLVPFPARPQGDRHRRLLRRLRADPRRRSAGRRASQLAEGLERSLAFYREHGADVLGRVT